MESTWQVESLDLQMRSQILETLGSWKREKGWQYRKVSGWGRGVGSIDR